MALVLANRVQETATPNTTVSFTLTGAVSGFQTFAVIGNTNTTYYSAIDGAGNWEVGLGTYSTTGPTLTRTTVYASSNSNLAVTFSGAVNVFVTYPSGRSVNLDGSGNVSALGTITSGTWQGSTIGVAYGGTGVTTSSGPNSVVLRDANENITVNRLSQGLQTITASGGVTTLTAASDFNQQLVGTGGHTFRLPDATTLTDTTTFQFNNNATGTLTIQNNAGTAVGSVAPGGAAGIALMDNSTSGGTWDVHGYIPENVTWGTNSLYLASDVITGGTWQGGTIQSGYGGTGLTTFTGANNALYSTSASNLVAGTLPAAAGGTGLTSFTANGVVYASSASALTTGSALTFDGSAFWVAATSLNTDSLNANGFRFGSGTFKQQFSAGFDFQQYYTAAGQAAPQASIFADTAAWGVKITGSEQMRLTSTGLGIGTSSPAYKLSVQGAVEIRSASALHLRDSGNTNFASVFNSSGAMVFETAYTERARITSAGNLGVGTTDEYGRVNIQRFTSAPQSTLAIGDFATASNDVGIYLRTTGTAGISTAGGPIAFYRGGPGLTESARIDSSGNLLVGTTSAVSGSKLVVESGDATIYGLTVGRGAGAGANNTAVGANALPVNTSGTWNTAVGRDALNSISTTSQNTAVGGQAGVFALGTSNTWIGAFTGTNVTGSNNTAVGVSSMYGVFVQGSTAQGNSAIGFESLYAISSGQFNTAVGYQTLYASTTGSNNVANGYQALRASTTASNNVAIGYNAYFGDSSGFYPTTGSNNVGIGYAVAGYSFYSKTGADNVSIGNQAAYYLNAGARNVSVGGLAGNNLNQGNDNVFVGYQAGWNSYGSNNTGNVYVGRNAGYNAGVTALYNVAIGAYALDATNTSSGYSVAVGVEALGSNTTAQYNVGVGAYAFLSNTTGTGNSGLGGNAGRSNTTGTNNTAVGRDALYSNTTSSSLTAIGYQAAYNMQATSGQAVAIGTQAVFGDATTRTASYFIGVGYQALYSLTTGNNNTAIGYQAGYGITSGTNNCIVGSFGSAAVTPAGYLMTTGSKNTLLGSFSGNYAGLDITTASNQIVLSDGDGNPRWHIDANGTAGYAPSTGSSVTQLTSRTNAVTINKPTGSITLVFASGTSTYTSFTVNNSTVSAKDVIIVNCQSSTNIYRTQVTRVANGSFRISFATTGGTVTDTPVFNFAVIKGQTT